MLFNYLLSAAFGYAALKDSIDEWIAPKESDDRSPCPGLNTMANHGILPRNGRNISNENIKQAFKQYYGISESGTEFFIGGTKDIRNKYGNLNLIELRAHNTQEHDASLVRDDTSNGPNWKINQSLLTRLADFSSNGKTLTLNELKKFRLEREAESKRINPNFSMTPKQIQTAHIEAGILFPVFGGHGREISLDHASTFLGKEKLPKGFPLRSESDLIQFPEVLAVSKEFE